MWRGVSHRDVSVEGVKPWGVTHRGMGGQLSHRV